jgi:hypothetical protein
MPLLEFDPRIEIGNWGEATAIERIFNLHRMGA